MGWNKAQRRISKLPTDVYRVYDIAGSLLYVGVSVNVFTRMREHQQYAAWWPLASEATVNRYENRAMARYVEACAIRDERPLHNVEQERSSATRHGRMWVDANPKHET